MRDERRKQDESPALQECEAGLFLIDNGQLRIDNPIPPSGTSPVRGRVQIVYLVKIDCQVILTRCEVALLRNQ